MTTQAQTTIKDLVTKVDSFATEVGKELKKTNKRVGDISTLKTTNKGDVVAAINEIKDALANTGQAFSLQDAKDGLVKDGAKAADTTYSSNKIEDLVATEITKAKAAIKSELLDGAEESFDTLKELQEKIKSGTSVTDGLLEGLGNRLRIDEAMVLTEQQQQNVAKSLGLPAEVDFVTTFRDALEEES